MTSKSPVRSCEDIDETALSYAEIKALCAGDERIKEKMDLDVDVARLRLMRANHQSQQYKLEDNLLRYFPEQIEAANNAIAGLETDIQTVAAHPHPTDGFAGMEVKGDLLTDKDNMDVYLEVSDEIAGQLDRFKLDEEAHRVRVLRAKAYFSLNRGDGIEKDALQKPPQPLELILKAEQAARLDAALRALSDCQRRRILAFYLDGESKAKIAKRENVNESAVRKSIRTGLTALKKFLNVE